MDSKGIALEAGTRSASSPSRFTSREFSGFVVPFICTLLVAEKFMSFKILLKS
jgi:hypothetical protein